MGAGLHVFRVHVFECVGVSESDDTIRAPSRPQSNEQPTASTMTGVKRAQFWLAS